MVGGLTWITLISAAFVDSINPCTWAVQIMLLSTLLALGKKSKVLLGGMAFVIAIYISYFLMGLGIYSVVHSANLVYSFYYVIIVIAFIVGVLSIRDYFDYKPGFLAIEIPVSWRPLLKKVINSVVSVPGAALVGLICSLFLLPCSSGPYLVILALLAKSSTQLTAIPLLLIYNAIFVLPMILITLIVYFGITTIERMAKFREKYIKLLHLISGVIMISLSLILLYAIQTGII